MWNPPVIDPRSMTRRSVLSEAAELLADLVGEGVRTICFLRSRRGIELIQRFTRMRLEELGRPQLAERIAPYRAGYTPAAAPRDRGAPGGGRAARGGRHGRARAGDRHRRARRGDLRHLPGHGREPAPDVGPGRAAQRRASPSTSPARTRSTSSSAATRRSSWSARWRRRSSITRTSGSSSRTCSPPPTRCRSPMPTRRCSASGGASAPTLWSRIGELRRGREGRYLPRGPGFPAGDISLRSASPDSVADRRARLRRAARRRRGRAGVHDRPSRAPSTCTWGAPTRCASSTSRRAGRSSSRSTATGTRSRRARRRCT